jgi:hypothetical protein
VFTARYGLGLYIEFRLFLALKGFVYVTFKLCVGLKAVWVAETFRMRSE